jgi:tetratricopeptide (TPR) repeat protein
MRRISLWAATIVLTLCVDAAAQESVLVDTKDKTRTQPTSADAAIAYAKALRKSGKEPEALAELRRAQTFASGNMAVMVNWELARTQIARRDFAGAMSACGGITKLPGGGAPAEAGGLPTKQGEAAAAARTCKGEAHLLWRRGSEAMGELAELAKISKLVQKDSLGDEINYAAKLIDGRSKELDNKETDAEASYQAAIALQPSRTEAHVALGSLLQKEGKDGIPELKKAVDADSKDPNAQLEYGRALANDSNRRGDAVTALEKVVAEKPTSLDAMRLLTDVYIQQNKLPDAKRIAAKVLALAPNDVLAHVVNGRVALADNKPDEALKEGEAALKIQANEGKAKLLVADAYAKKGDIDLALEAYQKASGLDPLDPTALVNATYACIAAQRLTSAKAFGQRAVLDFPNFAPAWVAQGDALAADGNPALARKAYESAKKLHGADVPSIDAKLSKLK